VLAGVAAAEFGVGGHGQVTLGAGGGIPVGAVGHDRGEDRLALPVGVLQGLVAGREVLLAGSGVVLAATGGGIGFGVEAHAGQVGVLCGGADLAELVADPLRGPGGLYRVGVAQVQQLAVGHAAHVGPVGGADGSEGFVPGRADVWGGRDRLGTDRIGGVVMAGQFPVGTDGGGPPLPVQPVQRVTRDWAEDVDRPLGACSAACTPIRSLRASISAAISVRYARRSESAMAGT